MPEIDTEAAEQWELVNTPLGEQWSGRTRYAAAMYFYKRGELSPEALEVYRRCRHMLSVVLGVSPTRETEVRRASLAGQT